MNIFAKGTAVFVTIATSCVWRYFFIELNSLLGLNRAFPLDSVWGWEDHFVERLICLAYYLYSLLLWYICVSA